MRMHAIALLCNNHHFGLREVWFSHGFTLLLQLNPLLPPPSLLTRYSLLLVIHDLDCLIAAECVSKVEVAYSFGYEVYSKLKTYSSLFRMVSLLILKTFVHTDPVSMFFRVDPSQ
jgi:hypothetical protein